MVREADLKRFLQAQPAEGCRNSPFLVEKGTISGVEHNE